MQLVERLNDLLASLFDRLPEHQTEAVGTALSPVLACAGRSHIQQVGWQKHLRCQASGSKQTQPCPQHLILLFWRVYWALDHQNIVHIGCLCKPCAMHHSHWLPVQTLYNASFTLVACANPVQYIFHVACMCKPCTVHLSNCLACTVHCSLFLPVQSLQGMC